jgi:hypothetical protein
MRTLRLISTTAAILLLGAGAVSAQGMKTNETAQRSGGTAECTGGATKGNEATPFRRSHLWGLGA